MAEVIVVEIVGNVGVVVVEVVGTGIVGTGMGREGVGSTVENV